MSLREQILAATDIQEEELYIFEWKAKVRVRALTAAQIERYGAQVEKAQRDGTVRALLVVQSCYDQDGNRIFEESDAPSLAAKSGSAVRRLFDCASRLNALSEREVEEIEGN
jgi:hypothetical protein